MLTALSGFTQLLKEFVTARKLSEGEARPAVPMDEIQAIFEWCTSKQSPGPPLLKLSWACCQDVSVMSMDWHSVKVCWTKT